jgi:hypothetical protein
MSAKGQKRTHPPQQSMSLLQLIYSITSSARGTKAREMRSSDWRFAPRVHERLKLTGWDVSVPLPTGILVIAIFVGGHLWDLRN